MQRKRRNKALAESTWAKRMNNVVRARWGEGRLSEHERKYMGKMNTEE